MSRLFDQTLLLRLLLITLTGAACFGAGMTAGLMAFTSEFRWPLSDANFDYSARQGAYWGMFGALIATIYLSVAERRHFWKAAIIAICATWLVAFLGVYWDLIKGLG